MEFRESACYMELVAQLREKYRLREEEIARMLQTRDVQAVLFRAARIREALKRQLLDEGLTGGNGESRLVEKRCFPGYILEKRVVSGPFGSWIPVNLYLPDKVKKRHPAVVVTMGHWLHGKAREDNQILCANLALRGAAAVTFDPIFQGERCRYSEEQLQAMFGPIPEDMWMVGLHMQAGNLAYLLEKNVAALFVREAMTVVDDLTGREDIDAGNILAAGQSGGGTQACYLAAVDDRIRGVIPVQCLSRLSITLEGGIGDCEQSFWGISENQGVEQGDLLWAVLPKPVLHCAGRYDYFDVDGACSIAEEMTAVYEVLGKPGGYQLKLADCGHALTREVREQIYSWVCRQFDLKDLPGEAETAVLSPEALRCRTPEEAAVGPVDIYRKLLKNKPLRDRETCRQRLRNNLAPVPVPKEGEILLKPGTGKALLLYVGPEPQNIPQTGASVLLVKPWGMESAYAKGRLGYDLETCMFNAAAVLGRNLCAERAKLIQTALEAAVEQTGAVDVLAVGEDAACVPLLAAVCAAQIPVTLWLSRGLESWEGLFEEGYFLKETELFPGMLAVGDLPLLRELVGAKMFSPRSPRGQIQTQEEPLWDAVRAWLEGRV